MDGSFVDILLSVIAVVLAVLGCIGCIVPVIPGGIIAYAGYLCLYSPVSVFLDIPR